MFGFSKKLITFVVPCYNSQNYMERCINTLLKAKDDCEIIIAKNRSGDTGTVSLKWRGEYSLFEENLPKLNDQSPVKPKPEFSQINF